MSAPINDNTPRSINTPNELVNNQEIKSIPTCEKVKDALCAVGFWSAIAVAAVGGPVGVGACIFSAVYVSPIAMIIGSALVSAALLAIIILICVVVGFVITSFKQWLS